MARTFASLENRKATPQDWAMVEIPRGPAHFAAADEYEFTAHNHAYVRGFLSAVAEVSAKRTHQLTRSNPE